MWFVAGLDCGKWKGRGELFEAWRGSSRYHDKWDWGLSELRKLGRCGGERWGGESEMEGKSVHSQVCSMWDVVWMCR